MKDCTRPLETVSGRNRIDTSERLAGDKFEDDLFVRLIGCRSVFPGLDRRDGVLDKDWVSAANLDGGHVSIGEDYSMQPDLSFDVFDLQYQRV